MKPIWSPPSADVDAGSPSFELLGQMGVAFLVIGLMVALAEKMGAWR